MFLGKSWGLHVWELGVAPVHILAQLSHTTTFYTYISLTTLKIALDFFTKWFGIYNVPTELVNMRRLGHEILTLSCWAC
jgi:hypothetical protein